MNFGDKVGFIWSVADLLRSVQACPIRAGYSAVDRASASHCVLEPTKEKVLTKAAVQATEYLREPWIIRKLERLISAGSNIQPLVERPAKPVRSYLGVFGSHIIGFRNREAPVHPPDLHWAGAARFQPCAASEKQT